MKHPVEDLKRELKGAGGLDGFGFPGIAKRISKEN
jgi:hypothetical protein